MNFCCGILVFSIFCAPAFAVTNVTVNCNGGAANYPNISAAVAALKVLPVSGNAVIDVTGVCLENVVIDSFAELTLNGQSGAVIGSPNSSPALRIDHSNEIVVHGFGLRGGNPTVLARRGAGIVIDSCNVGTPSVKGPGTGIRFEQQAQGFVINTSVDNFTGAAIYALDGSTLSVQAGVPIVLSNSLIGAAASNLSSLSVSGKITMENNANSGLNVNTNSTLFVGPCNPGDMAIRGNGSGIGSLSAHVQVACPVVIENNRFYGVLQQFSGRVLLYSAVIRNNGDPNEPGATVGVLVDSAEFYISQSQILNNTGGGITIVRGARGFVFLTTVQSNSTDGIQVLQGSVVELSTGNTVSGNAGVDLLCNTGANVFGSKTGIGKMTCPGFSSESGPKPSVPIIP